MKISQSAITAVLEHSKPNKELWYLRLSYKVYNRLGHTGVRGMHVSYQSEKQLQGLGRMDKSMSCQVSLNRFQAPKQSIWQTTANCSVWYIPFGDCAAIWEVKNSKRSQTIKTRSIFSEAQPRPARSASARMLRTVWDQSAYNVQWKSPYPSLYTLSSTSRWNRKRKSEYNISSDT